MNVTDEMVGELGRVLEIYCEGAAPDDAILKEGLEAALACQPTRAPDAENGPVAFISRHPEGGELTVLSPQCFIPKGWEPVYTHPSTPPDVDAVRLEARRWRHKKRGTTYTEVCRGTLQVATSMPHEDEEMVVYRGDDGKIWVRRAPEFEDGRFEEIATRQEPTHE